MTKDQIANILRWAYSCHRPVRASLQPDRMSKSETDMQLGCVESGHTQMHIRESGSPDRPFLYLVCARLAGDTINSSGLHETQLQKGLADPNGNR